MRSYRYLPHYGNYLPSASPWLAGVLFFWLLALAPPPPPALAVPYEVTVDDSNVTAVTGQFGFWMANSGKWSANAGSGYNNSYHTALEISGLYSPGEVRWYPMLAQSGNYYVSIRCVTDTSGGDSATDRADYYITYNNGNNSTTNKRINQATGCAAGWVTLSGGPFAFQGTNNEYVKLLNNRTARHITADAVRFSKVNTAPTAVADSLTVAEGGTTTTLTSGGNNLLTNDTDAESDPLTAVKVTDPSHGTVTVNSNGTFSYTHDGSETTSDSFTYKANDGALDSTPVTVSITISPANDAPVATADSYSVEENSAAATLTVLSNDTDVDLPANTLTISGINTAGTHGSVVNNGTNLTFTPELDFHGITTFTYTVSDGQGGTATATVTMTISELNRPPNANDDGYTVNEDSGANVLAVRTNDTDPNVSDTLAIIAVGAAGHGTVTHNGSTVSYTPTAGYVGSDTFTYTIEDNDGLTDSATVTITVANVNDAPVALADAFSVARGGSSSGLSSGEGSVLANDSDIDGDTLTAVLVANVTHGTLTLDAGGTFSYTHDGSAPNSDSFTYKVYDGTVYSNTVTVNITITAVIHELSPLTMADFTSVPINMTDSVAPLVMIASSNDHQLYFKAYNDYTDLDGDRQADTTYKPTIVYYGYFDSYKCYDYVPANNRFEPKAEVRKVYSMTGTVTEFSFRTMKMNVTALDGTADLGPFNNWTVTNLTTGATGHSNTSTTLAASGSKTFTLTASEWIAVGNQVQVSAEAPDYCTGANSTYWSGNFLNWISMSRIDSINKVLFGGHRRVDTATDTVLERAYLPHDAHSWTKYYNGDDIELLTPFTAGVDFSVNDADARNNGITFCNTTDVSGATTKSEEVTDPPLIKVAKGNYSLWAGNERWQCTWASGAPADNHNASNGNVVAISGINANTSSPDYTTKGIGQKNYVARTQACVDGLIGRENCKQYPGGNYKPIGLLQAYGDDDQITFGMVAGTYHKHVSGGSLIKNIESLRNEVNVETDGTFSKVAISAGGPETDNQADGIINAWSLFRIVGYNHGDGTYLGSQYDNCSWGLSSFAQVSGANECKNWGNPFSEIFFQGVRYFSDAGVTGAYQDNTSVGISGLPTPQSWAQPNPLGEANYCAKNNIIAFNSSTSSYDNDELDAVTPGVKEVWSPDVLPGADDTSAAMTDEVGAGEGINNNPYFVGEIAVDNQDDNEDQLCTAKTVSSLGNVGGLCPDAPRLQGSYRVAGIAYYAHTKDIRADYLTGGRALKKVQTLNTYAVSNVSPTKIAIPHPITGGASVEILPACRNTSLNPAGNCAIVDFRIVNQVVNDGSGKGTGKFYVNWEDSEQGGDYDQDMWGTIDYEINGNTNTLKITTDVHAQSTGYKMGFGYILSGTTLDGFHAHSGINAFAYTESAPIVIGGSCSVSCADTDGASTASYTLGASGAELLQEPLWYAAKWGGFNDQNDNGQPDLDNEWDIEDTEGNPTQDGIPDNYFFASNPKQLEDSLRRVFEKILERTSSGTAAAVVSNNVRGEGALYQAYYEPQKKDANGRVVKWIGTLHGLWLDRHGYIREDNGDGALGDYIDDPVIETYYDAIEGRTRVKRWISTEHDTYVQPALPEIVELGAITPLWNARQQMTFPGLTDNDLANQRPYGTNADSGRFIKTWIDADLDGIVDSGEYVDFIESTITDTNYPFFDMSTPAEVKGLVKYLRGVEIGGYRSRTVDYDGDEVSEVIRLGDIINSTPTMVAAPAEAFDLLYRDTTYSTFRQQYHDRRNVLYVGANDGMLHAFNAGFFEPATLQFTTTGKKFDGSDATAHPLGAELWAYVPMNLHPHLKWLKDPNYTHVYYMDAKPRIFDAKIFPDNAAHPNGWGTVMVVGMRLGGGAMTIDTGADGLHSDANDQTRRSAYLIFDITDPESEPNLLGEIQPPDGTFTTVYPAVMAFKDRLAATPNKWFLVFGNGPTSFTTGESITTAKLYIFDLAELSTPGITNSSPIECSAPAAINGSAMEVITCDTGIPDSFVGTPMVVDWNLDYMADTLYFGTVGAASANQGQLLRLKTDADPTNQENPLSWVGPAPLIDVGQPVYAAPTAGVDSSNPATANKWVFFGTGRLMVDDDKTTTSTMGLYGLVDTGVTVAKATLRDVSNVEVQSDGTLINGPVGITTVQDLESDIVSNLTGWRLDLPPIVGVAGVAPSTRMVNQQALLGGVLFSSVYQPSTDPCVPEGYSRLYGLYYKTGTALNEPIVFGTANITDPVTNEVLATYNKRFVDLGFGLATAPAIHSGSESGESEVSVFTQLSTGTIIRQEAETKEKIRSGKRAWRER